MTTNPPPAPVPYPLTRRRIAHPCLFAAGIVQLGLTHLAVFAYAIIGLGVGTCSGSAGSGACGQLITTYRLAGCALALNAVVSVLAIVAARSERPPLVHRSLTAAVVVSVILGIAAGAALS